ncbi:T9SS type A sorting domain-containing protein [Hymenobacter jeollabukensis]|uniref:T9SS type A sorting domain-containing protein n=1 Tax=Hymenobacter jeollabukensis TaxID=2025313 RepID=A0A5R8WTM5_9BACT|nr:T9SS type A sorting domain-containing protein [Hymenobacter jeollabukensis]TLM94219.1 T9SS type A sorting domain-containing protein [Hymenobacter jeollabukensis]
MRAFFLLLLLTTVIYAAPAQRLTRERVYVGASIYRFGMAHKVAPRHVLTSIAKRGFQMPGFWQRGVILDPQLDTTTTLLRFYNLNGNYFQPLPAGGYVYIFGVPSAQPADFQDVTLRRYRPDLTLRWASTFDLFPGQQDLGNGLLVTDEAYFLSAYSFYNADRTRHMVLKTDTAGTVLWRKNYGWSVTDFNLDMQFTRQGHLLLYGFTGNYATGTVELKLLLLNQQGDSLRGLHYAPLGPGRDVAPPGEWQNSSLLPLSDGGFLCTMAVDSAAGWPALPLAVKVDAQLRPQWTHVWRYQPTGPLQPGRALGSFGSALELADGSLLLLAHFDQTPLNVATPYYLLRLDGATGRQLARYALPSPACNRPQPYQLLADGDSAAYVLGSCTASATGAAIQAPYAARLSLRGLPGIVTAAGRPRGTGKEVGLGVPYPNPAAQAVRVPYRRSAAGPAAVALFDALGRPVRTVAVPGAPTGEVVVPLNGLPAGVYSLRYEQSNVPAGPAQRLVVQP